MTGGSERSERARLFGRSKAKEERHDLVIDDLRAGVPGREVLSGIDLSVRAGEVHAVMGPNGSGKSTLAHVLMGKPGYQVLGGRVALGGTDLLGLPPWRRARLGLFLAPQYPTEVPGVKLSDALGAALVGSGRFGTDPASSEGRAFGSGVSEVDEVSAPSSRTSPVASTAEAAAAAGSEGMASAAAAGATAAGATAAGATAAGATAAGAAAAAEAIAAAEAPRLGLDPRLLTRALNVDLSGGERKRSETLQLAVLRPRMAVLDELDSGLDIDGLRVVATRLREAVTEWGLGILAITHYRRLLTVLAPDAVHVLVNGRIVASGGPELAEEVDRSGYAAYGDPRGD